MFNIFLTEELVTEPALESSGNAKSVYGKIYVEDYRETFITDLSHWNRAQYEQHWIRGLQRLLGKAAHSVLITSYVPPPTQPTAEDFLVWWPLFREGDTVYVQSQLLFFAQLSNPFLPESPWDSVQPRQTVNPEGLEISEWMTTLESVRDYLDRKLRSI
jgi:hypothetical protein